ncbi:stromal membrane-associated protein 2 isoform X5 [Hippocampus comes]|uniref:stromal membrane-associated protein 2 isoform X5 n=1 Tax=Hippocampus comes TaxID=109280 RepID=UPI00094E6071|nr:PREDICTED: stromal membrane-associated protein 2-like isoform X5 [Hippocampus comes]
MVFVELGHLYLYTMRRHSSKSRRPHLQSQVCQLGPVDAGAGSVRPGDGKRQGQTPLRSVPARVLPAPRERPVGGELHQGQKEKSCENIPKEPVVFEKMKIKKDVSPKKDSQCVTDLLGLDAPDPSPAVSNGVPGSHQSPAGSNPAHPALDLFSQLSDPSPSSTSRVTASVPENLSLFLDPAPRKAEGTFQKLSKDSILSLYGSTPSVHISSMAPSHGLYMNQMGYPTHPYGSYHSLAQAGGMGGATVMSQVAMMGQQQNGSMAAQSGPAHHGMMGHPQNTMMTSQQNGAIVMRQHQGAGLMGHSQAGGLAALAQQQALGAQQLQWNVGQMTQHVSVMNPFGSATQPMGSAAAPSLAHMTAHVWK